jgi:hypothetical protein
MGIALWILAGTFVVTVVWAAAVLTRQFVSDLARAARHPRFGLVDLLLLVTVLGAAVGIFRWLWNSPSLPIAVLVIPPFMPIAWLARFAIEDAYLQRERRRERFRATIEEIEMADILPSENGAHSVVQRRGVKRKRYATWLPPMTPYSLTARPLGEED